MVAYMGNHISKMKRIAFQLITRLGALDGVVALYSYIDGVREGNKGRIQQARSDLGRGGAGVTADRLRFPLSLGSS